MLSAVGLSRLARAVTQHVAATGEAVGATMADARDRAKELAHKLVDAKDEANELAGDLVGASLPSPKRSRGRPRKGTTGTDVAGPSSPRKRAVKVDSDNDDDDDEKDDVYAPPGGRDVQGQMDGEEEPEEDVEAGVLGWGLLVLGGLGSAAAGVLGGSVCG